MSLTFLSPKRGISLPMFRQRYFSVTTMSHQHMQNQWRLDSESKSGNAQQNTIGISHGDPRARVPMGNSYLDCSHRDSRAMVSMGNPHVDQQRRSEGDGAHGKSLSGSATALGGRWCPWEILIWIAATEIWGRWRPWEILFTADYGLDQMEKLMWNHARQISPWYLLRKSARQRTIATRK